MSSLVKTSTPFINKELLLKALDAVGCKYRIEGDTILCTERQDAYGAQKFILKNGRYTFEHEKHAQRHSWGNINMQEYKKASSFIAAVGKEYNAIYNSQHGILERIRLAAIAEVERLRKGKSADEERLRKEKLAEEERIKQIAKAEEERLRKEKLAETERIRLLAKAEEKKLRLLAKAEEERRRKEQLAEEERLRLLAKAEEERKRAEEEQQRFERERKEFVAKQRDAVIAKAKEQGYDIRETVVDNTIKLVLVQTTY